MSKQMHKAFLMLFMVLISAPGILLLLPVDFDESNELRKLKPFPEPESGLGWIDDYPQEYEVWFNDNFGGRKELVSLYNRFRLDVLGASFFPKVIVGQDGWLFYREDGVIKDMRGEMPFSEASLDEIKSNLEARHEWLKKRDIPYLYFVVPNKHTVYGEYIPKALKSAEGISRIDQLGEVMKSSPVSFYNLTPQFKRGKSLTQLYYFTDTHWNDVGAGYGYLHIINKAKPFLLSLQSISMNQVKMEKEEFSGDLARLIAQEDRWKEMMIHAYPMKNAKYIEKEYKNMAPGVRYKTFVNGNTKKLKLLMFQDSFGYAIDPYLAETFGESLFVFSHDFNPELVVEFDPDIVIHLTVERQLFTLLGEESNTIR